MLTAAQLTRFATDGFVVVRSAVDEKLCASLDREIDHRVSADPPSEDVIGKHFYFVAPQELPAADHALRASPALDLAQQLTAPHPLIHSYRHIQIALNIPFWSHTPGGPHIDGYHDPRRPHPFTMLAGIFLGDESVVSSGNLWVWPGSHLAHSELFQSYGIRALMETSGHYPNPERDLAPPIPILAQRGDLILAHYLLGHNSGGNTTNTTRRAVYYRLGTATTDTEDRWGDTLTDPFHEYPSMHDFV